jgi:hypothetical protein
MDDRQFSYITTNTKKKKNPQTLPGLTLTPTPTLVRTSAGFKKKP